jgi:site-specific DNA-methyltransferase (adenine-specific)
MRDRETADWLARNGNHHPTVKPTDLMTYLCRLVTPPGGTVLDPFMGSGSTGKAAVREGFRFVGIDITPEYVDIARARIRFEQEQRADAIAEAREVSRQLDMFTEVA